MEGETLRLQQLAPGSTALIRAGESASALYGNGFLLSLHPNGFLVIFTGDFIPNIIEKKRKSLRYRMFRNVQDKT